LVELVEDTDSLLIIDEAYIDFVNKPYDLSRIAKKSENIIVLRSFTKAFGIPGLRLGYAIGNETNIWLLNNVKPPWNVSIVAQKIGCVLLKCEDFLKSSKSRIERTKEHVASNLDVLPSDVNFFLYKVGDARTAVKKLISKNIFVRDCTSFALPQYIRFSVRKHYETTFLIKCVKSLKK
jgi:histidinol-phosphate aminotransferase